MRQTGQCQRDVSKGGFRGVQCGLGIEPYPADSRHAASHTEAVPTFPHLAEGDTGTASSSSALWKATGTCHASPNPRIAGSSSFTVQVAMLAMFSGVQAEFGKIPFRDEAQLLRLDAAAAAHAEDEGTAGDIKVQYLFRKRAFAIPEDGMAACDILRASRRSNLPGGGEMALEDSTGSAEGYGASVEQSGVEGADGFRVEDACVFLCGGFVKGGEAVDVRRGADYGLSAGDAGYAPGQPVGASEMPGGEGNHMAAAFRTGKHGRVNVLVAQQWGGFAEGIPVAPMKICASNCAQLAARRLSKSWAGICTMPSAPEGCVLWSTVGRPSPAAISRARVSPLSVKAYRAQRPSKSSKPDGSCSHARSRRRRAARLPLAPKARPTMSACRPSPASSACRAMSPTVPRRMRSSGHEAR